MKLFFNSTFLSGALQGQYVQHALIENESHACMQDAISAFKDENPGWDSIRVFMVDKDFGEVSLLRKAFPHARVLICWFHLKKYLRSSSELPALTKTFATADSTALSSSNA